MTTKQSEWKHTVEIELPSGYTVEIRPLGYDLILKCNNVPDVLTGLIVRAFKGENTTFEISEFKQAQDFGSFLETLCELCFVHPQVVAEPKGEDQISPDMIEFEDKSFIFSQVMGKSRRWLELFRQNQQAEHVVAVSGESSLPAATEPSPETQEATPA